MTLRRISSLAFALAALAILAGPAWSARVVEVRVGNHPTFTRVVFELDAPAGYKIERREVGGAQELVVELSAASSPREVKSRSAMVAGVALEQSGSESVARIRLRGAAPRVKEMILGSPPRIVLDVMRPQESAARAVAPEPAPAAEPSGRSAKPAVEASKTPATAAGSKPDGTAAGSRPAATATAPKPVERNAPPRVAEKPAEMPSAAPGGEPAGKQPGVADLPKPPGGAAPTAKATPSQPAKATPSRPAQAPLAKVDDALEGDRIVKPGPEQPGRPAGAAPEIPAPLAEAPAAKPSPREAPAPKPAPPIAKAPAARDADDAQGPFGLRLGDRETQLQLGLVAAGVILFVCVVVMLLRRHSKPTSLDALEVAREAGEPVESGDAYETISEAGRRAEPAPESAFPVAGPGLFDDDREKGDSEMDVVAELPSQRGPRPLPVGSGDDVAGLVEQLERRMAQLESRLDEANEARERLERQVTAQSEELRVQRAAIARTQRALRGMTRGGEEQATEPALRDPSKPSSGRG